MTNEDQNTDPFDLAAKAAESIKAHSGIQAYDIALVLGSGWGGAADLIGETIDEIDAADVPGFSPPAVAGHTATMRTIRIYGSDKVALVL